MMKSPPRWTEKQFAKEAEKSAELFRQGRLKPTEEWKLHVVAASKQFEALFNLLDDLAPSGMTDNAIAQAFREDLSDAMRYLAGPFISADDLKVVAGVSSLAPGVLGKDAKKAKKAFAVIKQVIDPYRFPWVKGNRPPTETERSAALMASAVLLAASSVGTERRNLGKKNQEDSVMAYLTGRRFRRIAAKSISTLMKGPAEKEFCSECLLGERKADIVVRLPDTRLMAIECKVSNSATNSVKRINNDAAAKATKWLEQFGSAQVVPTAVISGVFKVGNLVQAQNIGLTIFWAHDLSSLGRFIEQTRA